MLHSRLALAIALVANGGQLVLALPVDDAAGNPLVAPGHEFNAIEAEAEADAWFAAKDQRDLAAYQAKLRGEAAGDGFIVIDIKDEDLAKQLKSLGAAPTLVMTRDLDALENGVTVNLMVHDGLLRYELNHPDAENRGLLVGNRIASWAVER